MWSHRLATTVLLVLMSLLQGCLDGDSSAQQPRRPPANSAGSPESASDYEQNEEYRRLRSAIFALRPEQLTPKPQGPHAVLMEMGYPGAAVTLVAVADGTANLHLSSGGGVIGFGQRAGVASRAKFFLDAAADAADRMRPATDHPLPAQGRVRFYLLSADGVRTAEAAADDLANHRHELSRLFYTAHEVITAIREEEQKRENRKIPQ